MLSNLFKSIDIFVTLARTCFSITKSLSRKGLIKKIPVFTALAKGLC